MAQNWLNLLELGLNYLYKKIHKKWEIFIKSCHFKILEIIGRISKRIYSLSIRGLKILYQIKYSWFENAYPEQVSHYTPQAYLGYLTLFLASEWCLMSSPAFFDLSTRGVTIYEIPGCQDELFFSLQVEILGEIKAISRKSTGTL